MTDLRASRPLDPDPELWEGLGGGELLRLALLDFYALAFADPRLGPFFVDVTQDWVATKQFSFLKSIILGDNSYFGYRPRNAHHWMVISDELFDYREHMLAACLARKGVATPYVERLRAISEAYRKQIVKDAPWPRKVAGAALPLEGYEALVLECGSLCDGCHAELAVRSEAHFHRRTGKLLCGPCVARRPSHRPSAHESDVTEAAD